MGQAYHSVNKMRHDKKQSNWICFLSDGVLLLRDLKHNNNDVVSNAANNSFVPDEVHEEEFQNGLKLQ